MKVIINLKKLQTASHTRGIGVYTRHLIAALQKAYPADHFVPTSHSHADLKGDVLHYPYFDPFFLSLKRSRKIPTIVTVHDLIPLRFPSHFKPGLRGKLKWWLQRAALRQVDHVITDSDSSKSDILKLVALPPSRISVIPLGPNQSELVPAKLSKKLIAQYALPSRYLLYVGDLNWNKNLPGLIKAFTALKDKDLRLVLVGKVFTDKPNIPQYHALTKAIATSGKAESVILLGYVPAHHLSLIYSLATLYVQPSWYEGFGLPVLEAMKYGCPVASSSRGSLKEIGGEAVAYFDPAKDMSEVIEALLRSPARLAELSQLGLARAKQFSWAKTARLTHAVYEKVLAARS